MIRSLRAGDTLATADARGEEIGWWARSIAAFLLAVVPSLLGCSPGACATTDDPGLEILVAIRDQSGASRSAFGSAEAVTFELSVRNIGDHPEIIELASAKTHDFVLTSSNGAEVWRASHGRFFAQMLTELTLAPGETRHFTSTWNQQCADGTAATAGEYRVEGFLSAAPPRAAGSPVTLTIR